MFDRQSVQHVILAKPYCTSHHAHGNDFFWVIMWNVPLPCYSFYYVNQMKWQKGFFPFKNELRQKKWLEFENVLCKIAQKEEKWMLGIHFFQLIFFVRYLNEVDIISLYTWLSENCGTAYQNISVHTPRGVINASVKAMESDCFT